MRKNSEICIHRTPYHYDQYEEKNLNQKKTIREIREIRAKKNIQKE